MLNSLIGAAVSALNAAGIAAGSAYPNVDASLSAGYVRVGLKALQTAEGTGPCYLGMSDSPETGQTEQYGMHCRVELWLDAYASPEGTDAAGECIDLMEQAVCRIGGAVAGLSVRSLSCGGPEPDRHSGLLRLRGSLTADALITAPSETEEPGFTDYILRGELMQ